VWTEAFSSRIVGKQVIGRDDSPNFGLGRFTLGVPGLRRLRLPARVAPLVASMPKRYAAVKISRGESKPLSAPKTAG